MFYEDVPCYRDGTIIDVRSREEYELSHAPNSVNIPWYRFREHLDEIRRLPKPLVFCCEEGFRSGLTVFLLKMLGFKDIYNIGRWIDLPPKAA
ncbi:MAG: rhodanese-like domain-containing protein [Saprospiraceae bacterium]|nr:rhodanese-like domain-containing protein [Saprospiraceae bacterium]